MQDFFYMDGKWMYIWSSYGITMLALVLSIVIANRRKKKPRLRAQKERKKRKQRAIKISNQHLLGTELGDLLTQGGGDDFSLGAVKFEKK